MSRYVEGSTKKDQVKQMMSIFNDKGILYFLSLSLPHYFIPFLYNSPLSLMQYIFFTCSSPNNEGEENVSGYWPRECKQSKADITCGRHP
jgi:hypothetical protein